MCIKSELVCKLRPNFTTMELKDALPVQLEQWIAALTQLGTTIWAIWKLLRAKRALHEKVSGK